MSADAPRYRYVVFPRPRQPTTEEVALLEKCAGVLGRRFAYGTNKHDGGLAVAFEAAAFERALLAEADFVAVVGKWKARGCEVVDHLAFVKDATALRPMAPDAARFPGPIASRPARGDQAIAAKELAAKEAAARSRLATQKALSHFAAVGQLAAAVPYLLMAAGMLGTILAGWYVTSRLRESGPPKRQDVIEHALADEPKRESVPEKDR